MTSRVVSAGLQNIEGFVTVTTICQHLQISPATVTKWRKMYGLPSYRFTKGRRGGTVLFKMSEVQSWEQKFREGAKQGGYPWNTLRPNASLLT
jgi:hypothetical protein